MKLWWLIAVAACGPPKKSDSPGAELPPPVNGLRPAEAFATIASDRERSAAMFAEAARVFQHPRCANCHPADGRPRQGDDSRIHEPPVTGGEDGHGVAAMLCGSCHQLANYDLVGMPGAPGWHLAPATMQFLDTTPREICERMKNPKYNGGKTLEQVVHHVGHDALVLWGWKPGADREPAPGDPTTLGGLIHGWAKTGAVCP